MSRYGRYVVIELRVQMRKMNNIYVGIDPSINSSGVYVRVESSTGELLEENITDTLPKMKKKKGGK